MGASSNVSVACSIFLSAAAAIMTYRHFAAVWKHTEKKIQAEQERLDREAQAAGGRVVLEAAKHLLFLDAPFAILAWFREASQ